MSTSLEQTIEYSKKLHSDAMYNRKVFEERVVLILTSIETMLFEKNRLYGNSALEPLRIFSKADAKEQIKVRIDDKLSRIAKGTNDNEDAVMDLIGYLILLKLSDYYQNNNVKTLTQDA
jgi:hypothetical protein